MLAAARRKRMRSIITFNRYVLLFSLLSTICLGATIYLTVITPAHTWIRTFAVWALIHSIAFLSTMTVMLCSIINGSQTLYSWFYHVFGFQRMKRPRLSADIESLQFFLKAMPWYFRLLDAIARTRNRRRWCTKTSPVILFASFYIIGSFALSAVVESKNLNDNLVLLFHSLFLFCLGSAMLFTQLIVGVCKLKLDLLPFLYFPSPAWLNSLHRFYLKPLLPSYRIYVINQLTSNGGHNFSRDVAVHIASFVTSAAPRSAIQRGELQPLLLNEMEENV